MDQAKDGTLSGGTGTRLFGTDGVRGVANQPPMTAEMALLLGRAIAHVCQHRGDRRHQVLIGKDTRLSGYMLENALTAGICSMGVDVLLVGPMPTPGIAFLTRAMRADAGVVISASHNPYQDNGIKIFSRDGYKLPDDEELQIEQLVLGQSIEHIRPTAEAVGRAFRIDDAQGRYVEFAKRAFPPDQTLDGLKLVLDCANGAAYRVAPLVFGELGADVVVIHNQPDGLNINASCGSLHPEALSLRVLAEGADLGLAFDGDADRVVAVDEAGRVLSGDHLLVILARLYRDRGWLSQNLVVSTVMSNFGLAKALADLGIEHQAAAVGDRYVLERLRQTGATLGGEASGHIICLNHHTTGDGIIAGCQVLAAMRHFDAALSTLAAGLVEAPQVLLNVPVRSQPPIESVPGLVAAIRGAEGQLDGFGRVLVRHSGTQAICRVMVESLDGDLARTVADDLAAVVAAELG